MNAIRQSRQAISYKQLLFDLLARLETHYLYKLRKQSTIIYTLMLYTWRQRVRVRLYSNYGRKENFFLALLCLDTEPFVSIVILIMSAVCG